MRKQEIQSGLARTRAGLHLLFPDGDPQSFWRKLNEDEAYEPLLAEIRAEAGRLLPLAIPALEYSMFSLFERDGSRLGFERVYFERRRRLNTMALMSMLDPEKPEYRKALCDILWAICGEYSWCLPAHLKGSAETDGTLGFAVESPYWSRGQIKTSIDLFAAETGFALSEILRLTESWLPPLLCSRIAEEVTRRLFKPYLLQGPYHWETAEHNWAAVCAGSIGSAALLLLEDADPLADITEKVLESLSCYLKGFGDDGACLEGVGYWNYGFGFFAYYADLLKKRTLGKIDLMQDDKVNKIAQFQQKAYLQEDITANFSDAPRRVPVQIGFTHYLASLYPEVKAPPTKLRASYTDDHCSRWAPAFRELLWFDPRSAGEEWAPADHYLEDAQWLVSRHTSEGSRFGMAAKGGHNDEPHNHNDIGHFILTCDGQVFLCDLGSGEYTDAYFGDGRYAYACTGSQGHSVPIIDGCRQLAGGGSRAEQLAVSLGEDSDSFSFDFSSAYRLPQLIALSRRFTWHKKGFPVLELEDRFSFAETPGAIIERFVSQFQPVIGQSHVLLTGEGARKLVVRYDRKQLQPKVERHVYQDHFGKPATWHALDFSLQNPAPEQTIKLVFEFH